MTYVVRFTFVDGRTRTLDKVTPEELDLIEEASGLESFIVFRNERDGSGINMNHVAVWEYEIAEEAI